MIPQYDTKLFTDVFDDAGSFVYYYKNIGIPTTISDANARTLYYLLYARYGNNPIANYDEEQFKYKIFSVVFQYGPTWEKRLSVQETLRGLQLSDLVDDGQLSELFSSQGSNSVTASGTSGNTRTLNTQEANTGTQTVAHSGTSATAHTGKDTVDSTGTQALAKTGTDTTASTGTQALARTGTDTTASTGTQALAKTGTDTVSSTGTQAVAHTGTVRSQGDTEDIKNHAFNPGTAPAVDAYSPLAYINEQHATKNDVDNTTTYNNTDTTTNNLQNQTTHATTDTTTNNLQNQTTHNTTDTTTNNLQNQTTHATTDTTTNNLKNETTRNTTDTTTNNLQDQTTNNLTKADTGTIQDSGTTSNTTSGTDSKSNSLTRTLTTGKLKAYEKLLELLDSDVTGEFISKFKICFKQFVIPEKTWIYVTEEE